MNLRGLVWRELIGSSHRRSTYVLRSLYLAVTGLLALSFSRSGTFVRGMPGEGLLAALGGTQFLCLGSLGLLLAHFSLAGERASGRLDLLLATGRSCAGIVGGKLAGALALPVFLLLAGVPAMLVALSLGGVSGANVAATAAVTLTFIFLMGSCGALGGALGSLGASLAMAVVYVVAPIFLVLLDVDLVESLWLPLAVGEATQHARLGHLAGPVAVSLGLSALCLWRSVVALPRPEASWLARRFQDLREKALGSRKGIDARLMTWPGLIWSRPLAWRERRVLPFTTPAAVVRLGILFLVASPLFWLAFLVFSFSWRAEAYFALVGFLLSGALLVLPGVLAASSAAKDKQRKAMELFLVSQVPERRIVFARVRSIGTLFVIPLLFLLAHERVGRIGLVHGPEWTWPVVATACSAVAFSSCVGVACGCRAKNPGRAVLLFLAVLGLWTLGPLLARTPLDAAGSPFGQVIVLLSPLPTLARGPVAEHHWHVSAFLGFVSAAAALYLSVKRLRSWLR